MKRYIDELNNFQFAYPDNWELEQNRNLLSLYNSLEGVGVLQFSIYNVAHPETIILSVELKEYLEKNSVSDFQIQDFDKYSYSETVNDHRYWRYWLFLNRNTLIFCSYNCHNDDMDTEAGIVNEIMNTLIS